MQMTSIDVLSTRPAQGGRHIVILGTGGTIAGRAEQSTDVVGYKAGQVAVQDLIDGVPGLRRRIDAGWRIESEQVSQVDSKDMSHAI